MRDADADARPQVVARLVACQRDRVVPGHHHPVRADAQVSEQPGTENAFPQGEEGHGGEHRPCPLEQPGVLERAQALAHHRGGNAPLRCLF